MLPSCTWGRRCFQSCRRPQAVVPHAMSMVNWPFGSVVWIFRGYPKNLNHSLKGLLGIHPAPNSLSLSLTLSHHHYQVTLPQHRLPKPPVTNAFWACSPKPRAMSKLSLGARNMPWWFVENMISSSRVMISYKPFVTHNGETIILPRKWIQIITVPSQYWLVEPQDRYNKKASLDRKSRAEPRACFTER